MKAFEPVEVRDPDEATRFVLQSMWLARAHPLDATLVRPTLRWAHEIAANGSPLLPLGFIADVGTVSLGLPTDETHLESIPPHLDTTQIRKYEDYVLGKLHADISFERGGDALLRFVDRERDLGLAFLAEQVRKRSGFGGVLLSPSVIRTLQQTTPDDLLATGWQSIDQTGWSTLILEQWGQLIESIRFTGDLLGAEDVFELEHGTALAQFGQRLALRQVLQTAVRLEERIVRPLRFDTSQARQIATHIVDEDTYPVGGFSSISTRGSTESLLHSQLAFMEPDDRPDLFDIRFLRNELLYYSRDDNRFYRHRRTFVLLMHADLIDTRFKDPGLPVQRIVLLLGLIYATVRKLIDWLDDESLSFRLQFVEQKKTDRLDDEWALLEMLFREEIANGIVIIDAIAPGAVGPSCDEFSRRSLCQVLSISPTTHAVPCQYATVLHLKVDRPEPSLTTDDAMPVLGVSEDIDGFDGLLSLLLQEWLY